MTNRLLISLGVIIAAAIACGAQAPSTPTTSTPRFIVNGEIKLAYAIDMPAGSGPFPAIVMAHGSGQVTRHDQGYFAQEWLNLGFAVLRYDKRGVGDSTGVYSGVGVRNGERMIAELASDAAAAARFLRTRPRIDSKRVGLFGNSQAGWILPHAARELGDVPFMVLWSGPVCTIGLENYYSDLAEWSSRPLDDVYAALPDYNGEAGYDPVPALRDIRVPTLWLLGADDRSIPVRDTVVNLERLATSGKPYQWKVYPGLGHSLSGQAWPDIAAFVARWK
ncbi:MAG TPA: alpha/beta hydrolase [Vicinamibacterales bacterium]|nr:alpha/beta hydrolase [Vicinamibacterales bacterium]